MKFQSLTTLNVQYKSALAGLALLLTAACGGGEETPKEKPDGPVKFKLSVVVEGSGNVTSSPSGIDCTGNCSEDFQD